MMTIPSKRQKNPNRQYVLTGRPMVNYMSGRGTVLTGDDGGLGPVIQWIANAINFLGSTWNQVRHFFHIGPSYDAANGGEVARQLGPTGTNQLGLPWCNAYIDWVKNYAPEIWQNGNIWAPGPANNSTWHDRYVQLVAAGMPNGTLLDANMIPVGMHDVVAAVEALQNGQPIPPKPPNPSNTDNDPPKEKSLLEQIAVPAALFLLLR